MKTRIILIAGILFGLFANESSAQCTINNNNTSATNYLGYSSGSNPLNFTANGNTAPYQLTLTNTGDLNILGASNGYMINSNYVLWQNAILSCIYVGVGAGNTNAVTNCTFMGNNAGNLNGTNDNTAIGYDALTNNSLGSQTTAIGSGAMYSFNLSGVVNPTYNTAVGYDAFYSDQTDFYTTAIGAYSLYSNLGGYNNTATGALALYSNVGGYANVAVGDNVLYSNTTGGGNTGTGSGALYYNISGTDNTAIGSGAMDINATGQENVGVGTAALYSNGASYNTAMGYDVSFANQTGEYNCASGYKAMFDNIASYNTATGSSASYSGTSGTLNVSDGYNALYTNTGGSKNTAIGADADVTATSLTNAAAIGYNAHVTASNSMILGDNSTSSPDYATWVGIGFNSSSSFPPRNSLEINARNQLTGSTIGCSSGLRFTQLTSACTPASNPGTGVLAVNSTGDVIYVTAPSSSGVGSCSTPTILPSTSGAYDLQTNSANFYFQGSSTNTAVTNVLMGYPINTCSTPKAKLNVLQASGTTNTMAEFVENSDVSSGTVNPFAPKPLIGIGSYIPNAPLNKGYSVAGWFETTINPGTPYWNYSIYVPHYGGQVCVGFPFTSHFLDAAYVVDINGAGRISAGIWAPSDTIIKKNVTYFKSGIKAVRQLNPVSFKFNGVGGFDSAGTHIGVIAENVARCAPYAVQYSTIFDSITSDTINILNVYEEAILYTTLNAVKEVDSAVRSNAHIDSTLANAKWSINGNAGLNAGGISNFVGTTDSATLEFRVNNNLSGWIDDGTYQNTVLGYSAAKATHAKDNSAFGFKALNANTVQSGNLAIGDSTLYTQSYGTGFNSGNVAIGNSALFSNQPTSSSNGEQNTAVGNWTLKNNTTGYTNTANGFSSLYSNTTGARNTATGAGALLKNIAGNSNTAMGDYAGFNNTGNGNTFFGDSAGFSTTSGTLNTYLGYKAGIASGFSTVSNSTCLGYTSGVSATTIGSNSIYLGNSSIAHIYGEVTSISTYSDRRIKENIQQNVPGLAFIDKLKPVTYTLNIHKQNQLLGISDDEDWDGKYDLEKTTQSGFVAQQVDSAAQACGYDFNGVNRPNTSGGLYSLGYTDFVVPLVKAVQELNAKNDSLHSIVDSLRNAFQNIQSCLNKLCAANVNNSSSGNGSLSDNNSTNVLDVSLSSANAPLLYQNIPNPFTTGTKINYYLPQGTQGASIVFYDNYGNQIKTVQLSQTGNGTLNVTPDNLSNGIYSYSLIVNGNAVDTKRMVLQK